MKLTKDQIEKRISELIEEGRNEDAVLCVIYEQAEGSIEGNVSRDNILNRLNEFLARPFKMKDLEISLEVLRERNFISGFNG